MTQTSTESPVRGSAGTAMRRIRRWVLRLAGVLAAAIVLYIAVIVYPSPLFAYAERYGTFRVYSDEPISADLATVIEDAERRIEAMENPPADPGHRIYLCHSQSRYTFFAFLLRMNPESLAIGLSLPNETFVSMTRVRRFAEINQGVFRHTRFEGNLAEVIAHEIAHFNSVHALGYRQHLAQPFWKSEGWAEYQANLAAIRADPEYDLGARTDLLLDRARWSGDRDLARNMWESQLLVEYLGEVEGYRLADLVREEVTRSSVRARMMKWHAGRSPAAPSGSPGDDRPGRPVGM